MDTALAMVSITIAFSRVSMIALAKPRVRAIVIPMGTKMATSLDIPMVVPNTANSARKMGTTNISFPFNFLPTVRHKANIAPLAFTSSKEPPIISRNPITSAASRIPSYISIGICRGLAGLVPVET